MDLSNFDRVISTSNMSAHNIEDGLQSDLIETDSYNSSTSSAHQNIQ